jgi:signal transduction histidine kinase
MKTDSLSNQLRWVVVLLAAAVILPTVCLLWFMNQAVRNERLAVRQRLETIYRKQCHSILDDAYIQICLSQDAAQGILVFDNTDKLTFPVASADDFSQSDLFSKAYALEFREKAYPKAIEEYQAISRSAAEPGIRIQADISMARCLAQSDRAGEAIERLETLLAGYDDSSAALRIQKARTYLLLLELMQKQKSEQFADTLQKAYDYVTQGLQNSDGLAFVGEPNFLTHAIGSELQAFVLSKYTAWAENLPFDQTRSKNIQWAKKLSGLLGTSLKVAEACQTPSFTGTEGIKEGSLFRLEAEKPLYGRYGRFRGHIRLLIFTPDYMESWLNGFVGEFQRLPSVCGIYDGQGRLAAGVDVRRTAEPFIKMPFSEWLPGWTVQLFVQDVTFDSAARKQTAVYLWIGLLVTFTILLSGTAAIRSVNHQIRINRLKNDFIATVTHELKTPLSSMRLLVDTLLEKRYTEEKTATEYLQLVANENKRLTHLIDSFLTFSRMERNKQVFDFQPVAPGQIATAATEAMQAKFKGSSGILPESQTAQQQKNHCKLSITIADNLPPISADKDAMITVLVNLLDNAYKYTNTDKHIELKVYEQDGFVCFAVRDNGIGISRRAQKKIFNRFYQVDSRLSRCVEGCGLGLSIVKFIVDAHKGKVEVQSQPGQGSTFTVMLPKV